MTQHNLALRVGQKNGLSFPLCFRTVTDLQKFPETSDNYCVSKPSD